MPSDRAGSPSIGSLILVPAIVSLAITLLRLIGELQNWSPVFFSREAGGGFALVGIAWLVPVFGFYFAWRLAQEAPGPGAGRLIGVPLVGLALTIGAVLLGARVLHLGREVVFLVGIAAGLVVSVLAYRAWPRLGRALLAYGLAARLPVILVMLVAILNNWGTHYDVPPPGGFPEMSPLAKWLQIGVVPQLLIWIPFTMVIGALFGGLALLRPGKKQRPASA